MIWKTRPAAKLPATAVHNENECLHKNDQSGESLRIAMRDPGEKRNRRHGDQNAIDKCGDERAAGFR